MLMGSPDPEPLPHLREPRGAGPQLRPGHPVWRRTRPRPPARPRPRPGHVRRLQSGGWTTVQTLFVLFKLLASHVFKFNIQSSSVFMFEHDENNKISFSKMSKCAPG